MIEVKDQEQCMNNCWKVYEKFRMNFYKSVCKQIESKDDKLTVLETITLEVIDILNEPTVNDVARFLEISQPNAAYKIGTLEKKGYLTKVQSKVDRREFHLVLTDKYYDYAEEKNEEIKNMLCKLTENYDEKELESFSRMLNDINKAMEPIVENLK